MISFKMPENDSYKINMFEVGDLVSADHDNRKWRSYGLQSGKIINIKYNNYRKLYYADLEVISSWHLDKGELIYGVPFSHIKPIAPKPADICESSLQLPWVTREEV